MVKTLVSLRNDIYMFLLGASVYYLLEILWRGHSHVSMFILGGFCGLMLYKLASLPYPVIFLACMGCVGITAAELVCGLLVNKVLKLHVWDYSDVPLNVLGQICPSYSFLWFVLSFMAITILQAFVLPYVAHT